MGLEELNRILEEVWKDPLMRSNARESEKEQPKREKKIFFLGERAVEPQNQVIFENGIFFVERTSECLVVRPKTVKEYLKKVRGTDRTIRIERGAKDILIPISQTRENPMKWFEQKYVESDGKRNTQGRFIREIWKHKKEGFGGVMLG